MAKIYIKLMGDKQKISWKKTQTLPFISYDFDEDGYREKSATIKTNQHLDLSTGTWQVLIVGKHENFAGIILTEDYDAANNSYNVTDLNLVLILTILILALPPLGIYSIEDILAIVVLLVGLLNKSHIDMT